ncbi:alpha/beta hydrolase [Cognatiyoonia sp. IB215182]|nr:alpha/beta hydrolase [Cognatiyoonia sp. IB215182]
MILKFLAAIAATGVLLFAFGYLATMGEYGVRQTVAEDPSLPSVELNGALFHAQDFGDPSQPTVIVVHGGPGGDHRALLPLQALEDWYHVVFYDQRGSGLSARVSAEQLNLDTFVADLDAIVALYGRGQPVHLIGHSWGGGLAAIYTARHPQKVDRLVLAEPVPLTPRMAEAAGIVYGASLDPEILLSGLRFWFQSLHVDGSDSHARSDYLFTRMAPRANPEHHCSGAMNSPDTAMWRMGTLAIQSVMASILDEEGRLQSGLLDGIGNYADEVILLVGDCSSLIGPAFQEQQMMLFPAARMAVIEEAGHMMFIDQPAASVAAIRAFLAADQ